MESINVGKFTTRVTILRPNTVRSQSGGVVKTFVEDGYVYADVRHTTGESVQGGAVLMTDDVKITCHPWRGMTSAWRVAVDGEQYEVLSVTQSETNGGRYMVMTARKTIG